MSLVQNINVPPEDQELWAKSCVIRTGNFGTRVDKKEIIGRRRDFTSLIARGNYQSLASLWDSLTTLQKEDWDDAGYWAGMSGWDLFATDTLYRINNGILGIATPDQYHQFKVGKIELASYVDYIEIQQIYSENIPDDFTFYFNAISDLTSQGAGSYAKLIVSVFFRNWNGSEWESIIWQYEYDLTLKTEWDYFGDEFFEEGVEVQLVYFSINIYKMSGLVYIDGVEFNYDDQNNARDYQCNLMQDNWDIVSLPSGSSFSGVYPPDNF